MKAGVSKLSLSLPGKVVLGVIVVTVGTGGFTLGYVVGRNVAPPLAASPVSQPMTELRVPPQALAPGPEHENSASPLTPAGHGQTVENRAGVAPMPPEKASPSQPSAGREGEGEASPGEASSMKKGLYTVQAGAFKGRKDAEALKHKLEAKGYKVSIMKESNPKGVPLYKVRTGEYGNKNEASLLALKLKKTDGLDAFATLKR
jgi:cell division protein FtsN